MMRDRRLRWTLSLLVLAALWPLTVAAGPAPTVWIQSPTANTFTNASIIQVVVGFQASPGNVQDVDLLVNERIVQTKQNAPSVKAGAFAFDLNLSTFADGPVRLRAQAFQGNRRAGHVGTSDIVTLVIDKTPPAITLLSPTPEYLAVNQPRPALAFQYSDGGSGVPADGLHARLDGGPVVVVVNEPDAAGYAPSQDLSEGRHTYAAYMVDRAGNQSAEVASGFDIVFADAAQRIGRDGGTVTIASGALAGARVVIPPGAVSSPTVISAREVPNPIEIDSTDPVFELRPHGFTFLTPVIVGLPSKGTFESLYHAEFGSSAWQSLGRQLCDGNVRCGETSSFGFFDIKQDRLCHHDGTDPFKPTCFSLGEPQHIPSSSQYLPVLFIHGYQVGVPCGMGNYTTWGVMPKELREEEGLDVWEFDYDTNQAIYDIGGIELDQAVKDVLADTGAKAVTLVAHSMGGLVARAYLQYGSLGSLPIARLITLGTPHLGTRAANLVAGTCRGCEDMKRPIYGTTAPAPFVLQMDKDTEWRLPELVGPSPQYVFVAGVNYLPLVCLPDYREVLFWSDFFDSTDTVVSRTSALALLDDLDGINVFPGDSATRITLYGYAHSDAVRGASPFCPTYALAAPSALDVEVHQGYQTVLKYARIGRPAEGLVAHYPLDGDALDVGERGHHAIAAGTPSFVADRFGRAGGALDLDGIDDYLMVPMASMGLGSSNPGTLSFWLRAGNPTTREQCGRFDAPNIVPFNCQFNIFGAREDAPSLFRSQFGSYSGLGWPIDTLYFIVNNEPFRTSYIPRSVGYGFGEWHLYTYQWGDFGRRVFFDDQLLAEFPGAVTFPGLDIYFGRSGAASNYPTWERLKGQLDDVRIYDRALTAAEVTQLWSAQR
jgi:pimeloyl-ACP methyl ester carboxylesterase